jgi:competence protein ComEC
VLQLPAAGHRSGASTAFLDAVDPGVAIVSSARYDRFDRPHAEVLERLEDKGIAWRSTARCGALRVRLRPSRAVAVDAMATLSPRFWRPRAGCRLDSRATTGAVQTRYHARWSQEPE